MATFRITDEETGQQYKITAPAGTPKEVLEEYAAREKVRFEEADRIEKNKAEIEEEADGGGFLHSFARGATAEWADELAGLGGAAYGTLIPESLGGMPEGTDFWDAYEGIRGQVDKETDTYEANNPELGFLANLAGYLFVIPAQAGIQSDSNWTFDCATLVLIFYFIF